MPLFLLKQGLGFYHAAVAASQDVKLAEAERHFCGDSICVSAASACSCQVCQAKFHVAVTFNISLALFDLLNGCLVWEHVVVDFIESDEHFATAVFEPVRATLESKAFEARYSLLIIVSLRLAIKMLL